MVQRLKLLVLSASVLGLLLTLVPVASAFASNCGSSDWLDGACPVSASNNGTDVTLEGTASQPGGSSGGGGSASTPGSGDSNSAADNSGTPAVFRDGYTATIPVTLADVAKFRPHPGTDLMQPNGWMIVGLSTNFYAHASQHVKTGTLLSEPAYVRFTPVRYHWTYGDGASRTTSTPGATWSALGITEFDETPTSHIYRAAGRYVIDLTIGYAPEYRLASGTDWIAVNGLVWVPANRLVAEAAAGAKTVLVEDECTIDSAGPGC